MIDGYYWLNLKDSPPEVVQIDGNKMYRCGSDVVCRLEGDTWMERDEPMDVVEMVGPIPCFAAPAFRQMTDDEAANAIASTVEPSLIEHTNIRDPLHKGYYYSAMAVAKLLRGKY